jgi:hypothetical protein
MCQFFSCVSDGSGKVYYFDHKLRKKCLSGKLNYNPDSHTSIADYFGFKGAKEDTLNKYEHNPLTKEFVIDQLNTKDDSRKVKQFCKQLNFADIVPELILKPFFHPLKHKKRKRVSHTDLLLLKQWDSVWASVGDSVGAYTSSFFNLPKWKYIKHKKGENPFQFCIDLWHRGIVASWDGNVWRLHGYEGKILKEITKKELAKVK